MPWQQSVFNLLIVDAGSGYSGEFAYNPGPGAGNLILSVAASDGTDPYGNAYVHGIITYTVTGGVAIAQGWQDGAAYFATAATQAGPYSVASGQLRALPGGYLNGFHSGNDVNGVQYPVIVTQIDKSTIVMAGRLLTPGGGPVQGTPFGRLGSPFILPAAGGTVPEFASSNGTGGSTGTVVLRPDGNLELYSNQWGNGYTIVCAGAFRF
jgi:hypothetical protein